MMDVNRRTMQRCHTRSAGLPQLEGRNVSNVVDNSVGEPVNKTEICCRYAALAYHVFRLDVYVHAIVQSINCYVVSLIIISFSGCYARQARTDSHTNIVTGITAF